MNETDPALTINRVFDAPREVVFEMWTNPDHLARWWGPAGFTARSCTVDLVGGGTRSSRSRSPSTPAGPR